MTAISMVPGPADAPASSKPSMTINNALALLVTCAFIGLIYVWIFFPPKGDPAEYALLNILIGALGTQFVTIIQYHFGSSKGSEDKTDTIKQLATGTGNGDIKSP